MSQANPLTVTVKKLLKGYEIIDQDGNRVDLNKTPIPDWMLKKAVNENKALQETYGPSGKVQWRRVDVPFKIKRVEAPSAVTGSDIDLTKPIMNQAKSAVAIEVAVSKGEESTDIVAETLRVGDTTMPHKEQVQFIHNSYKLKPKGLIMDETPWKFMVRSAIRGKNIMLVGDSGYGKTLAAKALGVALGRPCEIFNVGQTQDAKSFLIGNTHFDKETGTFFKESLFIKMCRTPNSVIILDELTRGSHDAWNILMTAVDPNQRYVRLDESVDSETVKIAEGVCFIATANVGNEYTATKQLDKALNERFLIVEMRPLTKAEEMQLLKYLYPELRDEAIDAITSIAESSRVEASLENAKIAKAISTRLVVETASSLNDGFKLSEAAEVNIYPFYEKEGGTDSERTFIKQTVQAHVKIDEQMGAPDDTQTPDTSGDPDNPLFTPDDLNKAPI
jgi:MoxR-like ATPase